MHVTPLYMIIVPNKKNIYTYLKMKKNLKNQMRKFFIYPDSSCLNMIIYCFLSPPYSKLNIWTVSPHPNDTQQIPNNVY